jgi:hypothetical protein
MFIKDTETFNEKESFSVNVDTLYTEFMSDEFQANEKYLDKTICLWKNY